MNFSALAQSSAIKKIKDYLDGFFYRFTYPAFLSIVAMLSFCFDLGLLGFTVFVVCACLNLLFYKDLTPFISPVCLFLFCFNDLSVINCFYFYFICGIFAVCLIAHFIKYPVKFYVGDLVLPLILFSVTLFTGGLLSNYLSDYWGGFAVIISTGPVILLEYLVFSNYINPPKNFDIKKYLCIVLILASVTASITMFYLKSITDTFFSDGLVDLKWGTSNTVASLLLFTAPCIYYLLVKAKHFTLYLALIAFYFVMLIISNSDGCLGIFILFTPFLMLTSLLFIEKSRRRKFFITILFFGIIALVVTFLYMKNKDLATLLNTADSGRLYLYEKALSLYKKYPIFGIGLGYYDHSKYFPALGVFRQFNFHSSILHVLATTGTFGILAYAYYLVARIKCLSGKTTFNFYALTSFLCFQGYALIDVSEFCLFPLLGCITLLITVSEYLKRTQLKNFLLKENFYEKRNCRFLSKNF